MSSKKGLFERIIFPLLCSDLGVFARVESPRGGVLGLASHPAWATGGVELFNNCDPDAERQPTRSRSYGATTSAPLSRMSVDEAPTSIS